MLTIENVEKIYTKESVTLKALDRVTMTAAPGQVVVVRGPSGAGKTTLLLTAGGLLHPERGTVHVNDVDLYTLSPNERATLRAREIGFVFQQFHLIPYLNVKENLLAASLPLVASKNGAKDRATELLDRFDMADRASHLPGELSTGQRQRTALARALMNRPSLLLADEPTGNLDPKNGEVVLDALRELATSGIAVVMVTHDHRADQLADRVLTLDAGKIVDSTQDTKTRETH